MDEQREDDQLQPIYNSSEPIQDIALKTSRERWTIETGGKRGSGIYIYIYTTIYKYIYTTIYIVVYIYIPDPLLPPVSIAHRYTYIYRERDIVHLHICIYISSIVHRYIYIYITGLLA